MSDLDRQLLIQSKEADMLTGRVTDLESRLALQGKILAEREYENNLLRQQAEAAQKDRKRNCATRSLRSPQPVSHR